MVFSGFREAFNKEYLVSLIEAWGTLFAILTELVLD